MSCPVVVCRARNAAMTEWRATGGTTTPGGADAVRDFLSRASLAAYDKEEEEERDKDQVSASWTRNPLVNAKCLWFCFA